MSNYDYRKGRELDASDYPFYALIQAAMRRADTENAAKLRVAFPEVWSELERRYNAPGGYLPAECPERGGFPHHFVPQRAGGTKTNPAFVLVCAHCGRTERETERLKDGTDGTGASAG